MSEAQAVKLYPMLVICSWCPPEEQAKARALHPGLVETHTICRACRLAQELKETKAELRESQERERELYRNFERLDAVHRQLRQSSALLEIRAMEDEAKAQKLMQAAALASRSAALPDPRTCEHLEAIRGICKLPVTEVMPDGSLKETAAGFQRHPEGRVECCTRCRALRWLNSKTWHAELTSLLQARIGE